VDPERARHGGREDDAVTQAARTQTILRRFPRHLGADDPGKVFSRVVDGLDGELEVKTVQLGRVRRSHALGNADEERDVLRLAGLHDLRRGDLELTRIRLAAARDVATALGSDEAAPDAIEAAEARLPNLLGVDASAFPAWPDDGDDARRLRLAAALSDLASYPSELDLLRGVVGSVIRLHRNGNGTIDAVLGAAAAYLELSLESRVDVDDRYWHVALCHDLLRLVRPEPPGARPAATVLEPHPDLLALEENPLRTQESDPVDRRHGDTFGVLRSGFETVPATIRVVGTGDRTVQPMVVNLDTGFGVVFAGNVPDGDELRFESDGRVTLGGNSVARLSYSFTGGVFADAAHARSGSDFVFTDDTARPQAATFAVTQPIDDAFDPGALFPHTEGLLESASLVVGESRWAFFVRDASFGRDAAAVRDEFVAPLFEAAVFDESVFQPETTPGSATSGKVGFAWQEHEPFAVRLWIPLRFSDLDVAGEVPAKERLRLLLDRHRAAGIHVYVDYADDRWTMPGGVLRDEGSDEPLGTVIVGTALWGTVPAAPDDPST
jgi:hypothetical protein